jgi:hypothetical protein
MRIHFRCDGSHFEFLIAFPHVIRPLNEKAVRARRVANISPGDMCFSSDVRPVRSTSNRTSVERNYRAAARIGRLAGHLTGLPAFRQALRMNG